MTKSILEPLIKKYYLSGINESAKWRFNPQEKIININTSIPNKTLIVNTQIQNISDIDKLEFGINDTTKLLKMLNVLNDEVKLSGTMTEDSRVTSIIVTDTVSTMEYVTADLKTLTIYGYSKPLPAFDVEIVVDKDFIETYIAARAAIDDVEHVAFTLNTNSQLELVFGQVTNNNKLLNTSKIKYTPKLTSPDKNKLTSSLSLNAKHLKEIFLANKDSDESVLHLSESTTLAFISFVKGDIISKYYLAGIVGK